MSFTKNNSAEDNIGKVLQINRDIVLIKGTIHKGSLVKVIGVGDRGYAVVDLDSGIRAIECGLDIFDNFGA